VLNERLSDTKEPEVYKIFERKEKQRSSLKYNCCTQGKPCGPDANSAGRQATNLKRKQTERTVRKRAFRQGAMMMVKGLDNKIKTDTIKMTLLKSFWNDAPVAR
jgi:hypothetical protein